MKRFFKTLILALGFFTTLPVPMVKWEEKLNKYLPLYIPLVGIIIGVFFALLITVLSWLDLSPLLTSSIIVVFFIWITGGLHLDAFMDTCDAHFSRRDIERKLEIMKDSNVGAFAVVFFIVLILVKVSVVQEIIIRTELLYVFASIPFISRTYQSLLLLNSPYAKDDGLAKMYSSLEKKYQIFLYLYIIISLVVSYLLQVYIYIGMIHLVAISYFFMYRRFAKKQFGGITGDIVGAYIEIVEVLLWIASLIYIIYM